MIRSIIITLFTAITITQQVSAQSDFITSKQFYFFKTWNWLKYYHPDFATGRLQADSVFLHYEPKITRAKTQKQFNLVLQELLYSLDPATQPAPASTGAMLLTSNIDTSWLNAGFLSGNIRGQLRQAYLCRDQGNDHHHLPARSFDEKIPNEAVYNFPDTINLPLTHRMLALAKWQGTADYLFPHKYLTDKNLDKVLQHYLPQMMACTSRQQYETILLKLVAAFQDSHAWNFYQQLKYRKQIFGIRYYIPFDFQLVGQQILVTSIIADEACRQAGIVKGDLISAINGQSVRERIAELSTMLSASNRSYLEFQLGRYANFLLLPSDRPALQLTVANKQIILPLIRPQDTTALRQLNRYFNGHSATSPDNGLMWIDTGIVYFKTSETLRFIDPVPEEKIPAYMDSLFALAENSRGIVFDMRDYPDWGGFAHQVYRYFGKTGVQYARYYAGNKENIGTYQYLQEADVYHAPGTVPPQGRPYKGKVVIIVNPYTRSMSEWNTMLLQATFPASVTIGEQTSGGDGDMKTINLPGNYIFSFTGNAIFYQDGTVTQRKGVRLDRPLQRNRADILSGVDTFLQNAIGIINGH